jgi:sugar (pentulose or hexulose) kinase
MPLALSVDWSAETTTVRVVDTAAHVTVGEGSCAHDIDGAEHDPDIWWSALLSAGGHAIDGLASLNLAASDISMIILDSNTPPGGLVVLGADGSPVHPAIIGSHADSGADASWLISHTDGGADAWNDATGILPAAGSTVALLSWLHRSAPDAWNSMARVTLPIGLLSERLGGEPAIGVHVATGTAVLDRREQTTWRTDLLAVVDADLDWNTVFPRVVTTAEPVGLLSAVAADALGIAPGLPLHAGAVPIH